MQDLTTGPLTRHLLKTTSFMLVTMVFFRRLYFLIDLYLGRSAWNDPPIARPSGFLSRAT